MGTGNWGIMRDEPAPRSSPARLARRAAPAGVGTAPARLDRPGHRHRWAATPHPRLLALLARGAEAFGFGVRYHPAHVSRLLRALGWSPQRQNAAPLSATRRPFAPGSPNGGRRFKQSP